MCRVHYLQSGTVTWSLCKHQCMVLVCRGGNLSILARDCHYNATELPVYLGLLVHLRFRGLHRARMLDAQLPVHTPQSQLGRYTARCQRGKHFTVLDILRASMTHSLAVQHTLTFSLSRKWWLVNHEVTMCIMLPCLFVLITIFLDIFSCCFCDCFSLFVSKF